MPERTSAQDANGCPQLELINSSNGGSRVVRGAQCADATGAPAELIRAVSAAAWVALLPGDQLTGGRADPGDRVLDGAWSRSYRMISAARAEQIVRAVLT
jgi:hypothetical protein